MAAMSEPHTGRRQGAAKRWPSGNGAVASTRLRRLLKSHSGAVKKVTVHRRTVLYILNP
jgi:hypothetical protein